MAEMREKLVHYFNIGSTSTPSWVMLGDGITSLTEELNPESETKQYINQSSGTTNIKSYAPSISVEREYISDALQAWIDDKIKTLPVGSAASAEYVRVNLMDSSTSGVYPAVKYACSYQFDSIGGDAGAELVTAMTLGAKGDPAQGHFKVTSGSEEWSA